MRDLLSKILRWAKSDTVETCAFFLFAAIALRLGGFFLLEIDWDESSFILMGQDILNGHLPYTDMWVMKPPMVFLHTAAFIALLGKTVASVRLGGTLTLFVSACLLHAAAARSYGRAAGVAAGLILLIAASIFPTGLAVMTETAAILPLCAFLYLAADTRSTVKTAFWSSLFLSLAILTKSNLVYLVPIALALAVLEPENRTRKLIAVFSGLLLPLFLLFAVYALAGQSDTLYKTMVRAPLLYTGMPLAEQFENTFVSLWALMKSKIALVWLIGLCGIPLLLKEKRAGSVIISFFALAFISILRTGHGFQHYFIVLVPFFALSGGVLAGRLAGLHKNALPALLALALLVSAQNIYNSARATITVPFRGLATYDSNYAAINELKKLNAAGDYAYFAVFPIGYWLTGTKLPTRYLHPGDIVRDDMLRLMDGPQAGHMAEMEAIFSKKPAFLVTKKYLLNISPDMVAYLNGQTRAHYLPYKSFDCRLLNTEISAPQNALETDGYIFLRKQ